MTVAVMSDVLGPLENYSLRPHDPGPPGPGQVRVAIRAAGVSFVDILNALGKYQGKAPSPFIPGSECAGVVEAVGTGVEDFAPGDAVLGTAWGGVFASHANLPPASLHPMPAGLDFAEGAVFMVSVTTAWHGLVDRGRLQRGECALVLGAGGATGHAAVQIAKYLGARVIASASSAEKRHLSLRGGADAAVDSRSSQWRQEVLAANGGHPVDLVFDPVGGGATEPAFRSLAVDGRHLVVGFAAGITSLATNLPLLKAASLVGVNLQKFGEAQPEKARANARTVLDLAEQGLFRPVVAKRYPLGNFIQAMEEAQRGDTAGRIVLDIS